MPARFRPVQRSGGVHVLRSRGHVRSLVDAADLSPSHLVLDLGAGPGSITAHLARTGARVIAIERSDAFVDQLHDRFGASENVRVVRADLRKAFFPHRPFQVVASIPFDLSTPLLRRLLSRHTPRLVRADLVVEWGFAKRLTDPVPRTAEVRRWRDRFDISLMRRIPADAFRPAPSVDCAHLAITRRRK